MKVDISNLINKLEPIAKQALENAATVCINEQNSEISVHHLLVQFLDIPLSDIRKIFSYFNIDPENIKSTILSDTPTLYLPSDRSYPVFSPLLVNLLQDSWLITSTELNQTSIRSGSILLALLESTQRYVSPNVARIFVNINKDLLKQYFNKITIDSIETPSISNSSIDERNFQTITTLEKYAENITELAKKGKLDPVLCRDKEIDLMIDILCRRRKNNPIIVGEAGVGKSAMVEGLAFRIVQGHVPTQLLNCELMSLDLGALQAGASVKGEFEKRFKSIMNDVKNSPKSIILFIDEAHTLIGAGNSQGGLDISNLLKPALARGELKTVAATTWSEYKKYFEKDAALSRRFQLVKLEEPNVEQAITILRGLQSIYESSHNVLIEEDALVATARLSDRYLTGRQLPDKAIDVLDTACARVAINLTSPPKRLANLSSDKYQLDMEITLLDRELSLGLNKNTARLKLLKQEYKQIEKESLSLHKMWNEQKKIVEKIIEIRKLIILENSNSIDNSDKTRTVQKKQKELLDKLDVLTLKLNKLQESEILVSPHVTKKQIESVIAEWTGVPLDRLSQNELSVITELPMYLGKNIKGQDLAIRHLHRHLLTARADLRRLGRPLGSFLLVGPSGVGKTETVIQIADLLFGGRQYLTTINMSEFQEKHTVSRLIGSPPGYVGYGEGGVLTEAIRRKPYSVVLLDEVEKAHPDVLNLFYQAFDKGELADGEGRIIDCKNVVFFLTSNLGYQTIVDFADKPQDINDNLYPELANFFKPALLARMEVIPYLPLGKDILNIIIEDKLNKLSNLLRDRFGSTVMIDDMVKEEILNRASRAENGARILESIIDGQLLPPVSLLLLQHIANKNKISDIHFIVKNNEFSAKVGDIECNLN